MTNDEILYDLITKTNLPFTMDRYSDVHVKFTAPKVCVVKVFDNFVHSNYDVSKSVTSDKVEIGVVIDMFNDAIEHESKELQRKLNALKEMQKERTIERNGKSIAYFLNLKHENLKEVGGSYLIFVNDMYPTSKFTLKERAKDNELLDKYLKEFDIIPESIVCLMDSASYNKYINNGRVLEDENIWV